MNKVYFEIMSTDIENMSKYLWYEHFLVYCLPGSQPCSARYTAPILSTGKHGGGLLTWLVISFCSNRMTFDTCANSVLVCGKLL